MTNSNATQDTRTKTFIITGGTSGIGLATAKRLAGLPDVRLVLAGRDAERGATVARQLSDRDREARFVRTDVRVEEEVASLVSETIRLFGRIDAVFNNAGTEGTVGPMMSWSPADIDLTIDTNVKGAFYVMKHAGRAMQQQRAGLIVNCASVLGLVAAPIAGPYAASKAALLHLTRCAAAELVEHDVKVVAVCPTVVDTPMMDRVSDRAGAPKQALAEMVCPSGQLGSAETISGYIVDVLDGSIALEPGAALLLTEAGTHAVTPALFQ